MRSNWLNACSLNKKNFINWFFEQKYSPFLPCSSLFRSLSQCWFMSSSMHFIQSTRKDFHLELPGSTKRRPWNNVMALVHFHSVSIFNYTISKLLSAERTFSKKSQVYAYHLNVEEVIQIWIFVKYSVCIVFVLSLFFIREISKMVQICVTYLLNIRKSNC